MALDLFFIFFISAECERVFSAAKILISDKRNYIKNDIIEVCIILRYYYYYYYSSNLRAHAVCDYGTLPIMRQDLSSYLTTYIYEYIRSYRMIFFYPVTVKLSNYLLRLRDSEY